MHRRERSFSQSLIVQIKGFLLLLFLPSGYASSYTIDTTQARINGTGFVSVKGNIENRTFSGPNNGTWNYSVAIFTLNTTQAQTIFSSGHAVNIEGVHALSVKVNGNFTVSTDLDVSGRAVSYAAADKPLFRLGGFVRVNKSCCTLGAGPGGAFNYHGGGHGGRGGGFYQDRNTSRFFGWSYYDTSYLLGGSTGTVLFDSKSGSGGGAIELIAVNGTLTINASILTNGYTSANTSEEHCAGGSSGGLIRLQGDRVVIGSKGRLSAIGGDSGYSSNLSHYCGGGGGGGVIQVFSSADIKDYTANSSIHTCGGRGIQDGEEGLEQVALHFGKDMDLNIDTTNCEMRWSGNHREKGEITTSNFNVRRKPSGFTVPYKVCKLEFMSSIFIGREVRVDISGAHALSLTSTHGNIEVYSPINIGGSSFNKAGMETSVGGYIKTIEDGIDTGPANFSNCTSTDLYGQDFKALLGGSVCLSSPGSNVPMKAVGGGALELRAAKGAIAIAETISADGFSNQTDTGAMGGTIRLYARQVLLRRNALLTARSSTLGSRLASGGVIQIRSSTDVKGLCDSKFNVSGGSSGLVNILVSTANTYQVQYIQKGSLQIDTTNARWTHKTSLNSAIAYSYYGKIESKSLSVDGSKLKGVKYKVAKFEFQTPILINGSAVVELSGLNSLSVSSKEGFFLGVDIVVGETRGELVKTVGGYCANRSKASGGEGPGRGKPLDNGGAGHGGQGGLLYEDESVIYGDTYGIRPYIHLIGGSTGTSNCSSNNCTAKDDPSQILACGGGAIKISSEKNLTINAAIKANGKTYSILHQPPCGGSSGGTIILKSKKHVILSDKAILEAKGADGVKGGSGGGGGVIAIFFNQGFAGEKPAANQNTKGGDGAVPGDNGVVFINETWDYGYPAAVNEENYLGCVNISAELSIKTKNLKAHEASPKHCNEFCLAERYSWAAISLKRCFCMRDNYTAYKVDEDWCKERCRSNTSLICGGKDKIGSAYRTGYNGSSSSTVHVTSLVSAVYPTVSAEISPSSVVLPVTSSESPEPTEISTTSPTRSPTESSEKVSEKFKEIANVTITEENSLNVVEKLKNLTSEEKLNGGDTKVTITILQKIVSNENLLPKDKQKRQKLGQSFVKVASSLLSEENKDSWGIPTIRKNNTNVVTSQLQILEIIDDVGLKIGEQLGDNESYVVESPNIAMGVDTRLPDESAAGVEYPRYHELSDQWPRQDRAFVPKEVFDQMAKDTSKKTIVVYTIYNQTGHFPVNTSSHIVFVNSPILGVQFNKPLRTPFKKPVKMWFSKLETKNASKPSCSFVEFTQNGGSWSNEGCHVVENNELTVECACDHLTNFAILMQVKEFEIPAEHLKVLTIITYVGCGISLFGLALTLATFLSLETLASERTSIHKNLVVAIGFAQIVFLAGIDAIYNPIACKAVALFLHYLYTAAFTWMLCEGIHLYSKVVEVFTEGSKMKYYYALGWGLPLTIVFISACSRWGGYGNERACWISIGDGLIWAFVAPVLVIMSVNFVVMIMVIKVIITSVTSLQNPGNTSQVRAGVKGMIVLLPLLGLTWVFGIMAINKDTIAFQYLFAILNSLQGLFIFAFHCIGNTEVRVAYRRLHEKRTLAKSLPEHSLSSSHHSREKRRMDSHETHLTGDDDIIVTKTIRSVSDVKISGDNMAMQTFGDTDSGRWSLNCPSPDPFLDLDHAKRA